MKKSYWAGVCLLLAAAVAYGATTYTTNYQLAKPGDGDENYGELLRDNFDTIDSQLKINADSSTDHTGDTVDAHDSTAISTPGGSFVCTSVTTVEAYLDCLDGVFDPGISGVVLLTGAQTITGVKTFNANPVFAGAVGGILNTDGSGILSASSFSTLSPLTTQGDLLTNNGASDIRLAIGSANTVLKSDGTSPSWAAITDSMVDSGAAIARSKLASGTADHVVINNGSGVMSSEAQLASTRGGTGVSNAGSLTYGANNLTFVTSGVTSLTLPTTGTVATLAGAEAFSGKTQIDVDNLRLDGNTLSSTNTDGNVVLDPNGTGAVRITDAVLEMRSAKQVALFDLDNSNVINVKPADVVSSDRTVTFPDLAGTVILDSGVQTLNDKNIAAPTISNATLTFGATLQGDFLLQNLTGSQPTLQLSEDPDNGTNKIIWQAPAVLGANYTLTLPADDGGSSQFLQTDGSGGLTWATPAGSSVATPTTTGTVTSFVPVIQSGVLTSASTTINLTTTDGYQTVLASDTSSQTINLPAGADNDGRVLQIKKTNSGGTVTIDANASETIDGATTKVLAAQYDSTVIVCDGTNWVTIDLPDAGSVSRGAVSTGTQTLAGAKTFANEVSVNSIRSISEAVTMASSASQTVDFTSGGSNILGNSTYLAALILPENSTNYAIRTFHVMQGADPAIAPTFTAISNVNVGGTSINAPTTVLSSGFHYIRVTVDPAFTDDVITLKMMRIGI